MEIGREVAISYTISRDVADNTAQLARSLADHGACPAIVPNRARV